MARLIGVFSLVIVASLLLDQSRAMETIQSLIHDPSALIILGVLGTATGLAIVLGHQVWSGGALPVIMTVLGRVILVRGMVLLFLPLQLTAKFVSSGFASIGFSMFISALPLLWAFI